MSPDLAVQHPLPPSSRSALPPVARHQLWLDDAPVDARAPAPASTLRLDLSALGRVPPSSIRGPLRTRAAHAAWPQAADEPPTLSVRRATLRVG